MPIAVACPKCQKKFNLPDQMLGRPVKCSACGVQFKTPARRSAPAQQVDPKQLAQQQRAMQAAQQQANELKRMGIDGPIQRSPDVFDGLGSSRGTPDPLGNHMIEDPGFSDVDVASPARPQPTIDDDPHAAMFENPAIQTKKLKPVKSAKGKKKKRGKVDWYSQPWFFLLVIFVPLFAISFAVLYFDIVSKETGANIAYINVGIFAIINAMVGFWGLSLVAEEGDDVQLLLCRFVPGYLLIYIFTHWNSMKDYAYAALVGILLSPFAVIILAVAKVLFFASEVGLDDIEAIDLEN